jgi:hypothetical protein
MVWFWFWTQTRLKFYSLQIQTHLEHELRTEDETSLAHELYYYFLWAAGLLSAPLLYEILFLVDLRVNEEKALSLYCYLSTKEKFLSRKAFFQ